MNKRIVSCFLMILLLVSLSIRAVAVTSDAPPLVLTAQEQAYFAQLKSLRILTAPHVQPYVYENMGVSIDILEALCATADIPLELVEAESYSDALIRLERGEAALAAVKILPLGSAEDILHYLNAPLQTVRHEELHPTEQSSLSIAQIQGIDFNYDIKYSFVNTETFSSVSDCLDAVRGRQADVFLCDIYQLSVFSGGFAARNLTTATIPNREASVGFGLSKDTDARLISALQCAVDSFSTSELGVSLSRHTQHHDIGFRAIQFVYENPFELLFTTGSLFFVILLCIFVFFRIRGSQAQALRGYEESYRMLADTFGEAGLEYDFLSDRLTFFSGCRNRIDLPEVVEQAHLALEQGALRTSLTPEELDTMLQNNALNQSYQIELQCGMREGNWNWFRLIYIVVCTSESHRRPIRLIGCLVNIEEERQEKERLLNMGRYDQLTGLLSRASGESEMMQTLATDATERVLLVLDIDYFKNFNDRYGHSCGDAVLRELGAALREVFSQEDILSRWGGDEFVLLVKGEGGAETALSDRLSKLQERLRGFSHMGQPLRVTLSIGGTVTAADVPFQALFELADATLYAVKKAGRDQFRIVLPTEQPNNLCREARE